MKNNMIYKIAHSLVQFSFQILFIMNQIGSLVYIIRHFLQRMFFLKKIFFTISSISLLINVTNKSM